MTYLSDQQQAEALKKLISDTFTSGRIPERDEIVATEVQADPDSDEIVQRLGGRAWPDVLRSLKTASDPNFLWWQSFFRFLRPAAFAYYLPAFMIVSVDLAESEAVGESLVHALAPEHSQSWLEAVTIELSSDEVTAVRDFIGYLLNTEQIDPAWEVCASLRAYWRIPH